MHEGEEFHLAREEGRRQGERSPHLAKVDAGGGEWRKIPGTHSKLHLCWMPRTTYDSSRDRKGCGRPVAGLCLLSSGSYLYWVTAGLAFAEQWNVTTLSSSTGCGSTDRLTSGGSAERRDSLADWGAVFMVLGKNEVGRPRKTPWVTKTVKARSSTTHGPRDPQRSHHSSGPQKVGGLSGGAPLPGGACFRQSWWWGQGSLCGFKAWCLNEQPAKSMAAWPLELCCPSSSF